MKRIISIIFVLLVLCGCAPKIIDGDITIDLTQEFDVNTILDNVKEDTQVSYELDRENSKIIVTLINDDKTETLEKEVTILEPQYTIKDDIKFNPYLDYNINDFITVDDGVKVDHTVDTKASKLIINLSKGHWSKTVEADVTLESIFDFSNVGDYGALIYKMTKWENKPEIFMNDFFNGSFDVMAFAEDHTGFVVRYRRKGGIPVQNSFTWTENGKIVFDTKYILDETSFFAGSDGIEECFIVENNNLKIVTDENGSECIYLEKVESFTQPYNTLDFLASYDTHPGKVWPMVKNLDSFWYEPDFVNYSIDYKGVENFADQLRLN